MFLADLAQDIHLIYLENDSITCNGANVLAFDAGIDWDIKMSAAPGAMAGGCSNMSLSGTGWVAIISDGPPVLLNVAAGADVRRPAGGDHLVLGRHDLVQDRLQDEGPDRQGLGRAGPDRLRGQGWVLVQPSEGTVKGAVGATGGGGSSRPNNPLGSAAGPVGAGRRPARRRAYFTS